MVRRCYLWILTPLFVSACNVGPDYQTPKLNLEHQYSPTTQPSTQPATTPASVAWWNNFHDPQLNELIALTSSENLDFKQAQERIREARALRKIIAGADLPTVNADAAYQRTQLSHNAAPYNAFSAPNFPWEFNTYQAGFDASWEIDIFGGTRRAVESATASLEATIAESHAVLISLQSEVAHQYIALRSYQKQRELAQHNLELQKQTLALTRDRVKNGVGSELDVARAAALVAMTSSEIPLYERGEWNTLHRLAVLTHQPLEKLETLRTTHPKIPGNSETLFVGVPADLLRRRPDLRQAERQLAAATAQVGLAESELYPKLYLTGAFNLQADALHDMLDWRSRAYSLGPSVSWPIFEGGRLRSAVDARNARQHAAYLHYEQTVQLAVQEVRDQMVTLATEKQRQESLTEAVKQNRDAADLAEKLYTEGLGDFLTVLDAQRQLNLAENAQARSTAQLDDALIGVYKALGGGWDIPTAATQPKAH